MTGSVVSVNLAGAAEVLSGAWTGTKGRSGIGKRPVTAPVHTGVDQLAGDTICDLRNHGGPDQAVYAYAGEDARWWAAELDRAVGPGAFGENLTTEGVEVTDAVIGERWAIGSAEFEVSVPRIPCRVFAGFWDVADLIKRFTAAARPGAYLRIASAGSFQVGAPVRIVHRPEHGVTIAQTFRALTGDRSLAPRLLDAPQLPTAVHARVRSWLRAGADAGSG